MFIGSTSITPIRQDAVAKLNVIEEEGGDADERDEADGTEEDVNLYFPMSEVCAKVLGCHSKQSMLLLRTAIVITFLLNGFSRILKLSTQKRSSLHQEM